MNKLPTNYVDAVATQKKFKMTNVSGSNYLIEDVTTYSTQGSYYGANDVNKHNKVINQLIDLVEEDNANLTGIIEGNILVKADTADNVSLANTSTNASVSTYATEFTNPRKINNVTFDGKSDITVEDSDKVAISDSFILFTNKILSFSNNVCTITDSRITSNSLADLEVYYGTIEQATRCALSVETYNGYLTITAHRTPKSSIQASCGIRR